MDSYRTNRRGVPPLLSIARTVASLAALAALLLVAVVSRGDAYAQAAPPTFLLPWQNGDAWLTGVAGFHGTNDAIDFFPPDAPLSLTVRCEGQPDWVFEESAHWILASAAGKVEQVAPAYVLIYHGDGWFTRYWHLSKPQVKVGDNVLAGTRLGHPSTLGECATGPHVHFWVSGSGGLTTRHVSLSGIPSGQFEDNIHYSQTGNFTPGYTPSITPTPSPTPEATPTPTGTLTPEPTPTTPPTAMPTFGTPTPSPTPIPEFARGDANCDGTIDTADAVFVLRYVAGVDESKCLAATAEVNCDGSVTIADAIELLRVASAGEPIPECAPETPRPTDEAPSVTPAPEEDDA